jgi:PAS domain S-box-containing protein
MFEYYFAGKPYNVRVNLKIGKREVFLQKIPILLFLFGVTLTLIGTLYVRNNQRQSQKLSSMNKELAHKNFELSHEVAERERLNDLIKKSERENKSIVNSVSDIIFELDTVGTILFLNASWEKVTGFESQKYLGRNIFHLFHETDRDEQKKIYQELINGKRQSYRSFSKIKSSDGKYRSVEIAFSMLRQDEGQDIRAVGTITDVEERRRAEQALANAEKKYRTIVENAANGIYQVTPEGQFLSVNPSFASILGYASPEEVLRDISNAHDDLYEDKDKREQILKDVNNLKV